MACLEYKIGGLNIDANGIFEESAPFNSRHKFVVSVDSGVAYIYVSKCFSHSEIVWRFNLDDKKIYGGGDIYVDYSENLVLGAFSGKFDAVPKEVAEKFAQLICPYLKQQNIKVEGVKASPNELLLHQYWRNL